MSRTYRKGTKGSGRERHLAVRAVRRTPADLRKLSRALIELAIAQAEAEAAASSTTEPTDPSNPKAPDD